MTTTRKERSGKGVIRVNGINRSGRRNRASALFTMGITGASGNGMESKTGFKGRAGMGEVVVTVRDRGEEVV